MPSSGHTGRARGFRRPTLRARMALLYGVTGTALAQAAGADLPGFGNLESKVANSQYLRGSCPTETATRS